jgi:hypothetical protein
VKKPNLLRLDIQYFAGSGFDEFDMDKFDKEFADEVGEIEEETNDEVVETEEENADDVVSDEEPTEEAEEVEETPPINDPDTEKRNRAFADMRRELEESKKYAEFIKRLADENGMSPDDIVKQYEERQLQQEAEAKNTDPEVLRRVKQLEQENNQVKEQAFSERFNSQVQSAIEKYGANEDQIRSTFQYAVDNGIDFKNSNISFDAAYRLAHMDDIVNQTKEQTRQELLASKKKRQQDAAIPNGEGSSQFDSNDLEEAAIKDARAILENW